MLTLGLPCDRLDQEDRSDRKWRGTRKKPTTRRWSSLRKELALQIAAHSPAAGENTNSNTRALPLSTHRATPCYRGFYEPSLNVFAQGRKSINLGGTPYLCDESSFLLSSIDVPVESQIVEASEDVPLLSLLLRLEMPIVRELLTSEELPELESSSGGAGLSVGETTVGLLEVCCRLIRLLDSPSDIPFLSRPDPPRDCVQNPPSPQGGRLRAIATTSDVSHKTARAITWLRDNYAKPLHIEELADTAEWRCLPFIISSVR